MTIEILKDVSESDIVCINRLLSQLTGREINVSLEHVEKTIQYPNVYVLVARNQDKISGMACMFVLHMMHKTSGFIEDFVVDESTRGKGIGSMLIQEMMRLARSEGITELELTSRPSREAANVLYQKLGFKKRETNVYRYTF